MSDTTIYPFKVNKEKWKKFKGTAMLDGFESAAQCLNTLVTKYLDGDINAKK
mgnify:CR=1 FL=1